MCMWQIKFDLVWFDLLSRYATLVANEPTLASSSLMRVMWSISPRSSSDKATPCVSGLFCILSIDYFKLVFDHWYLWLEIGRERESILPKISVLRVPITDCSISSQSSRGAGISSIQWRGWIKKGHRLAAARSCRHSFWPSRRHYKLTFLKLDLNCLGVTSDAWPNQNI